MMLSLYCSQCEKLQSVGLDYLGTVHSGENNRVWDWITL